MDKEKLSEDFAVKIMGLEKFLRTKMHERVVSHQICKSGTSIGANISESTYAESTLDYIHKLKISQKECNETLYWLRVLYRSNYLEENLYNELYSDAETLMKIINSIIIKINNK